MALPLLLCWLLVRCYRTEKGERNPSSTVRASSGLVWEDACPMAETTAEQWHAQGRLAQVPVCSWPLVYAGEAVGWHGAMDQHEAGCV